MLDLPCDIYTAKTVGELLRHIAAAELRFAERLHDLPVTEYAQISYGNAEEIFATHDRALKMLRALTDDASFDWDRKLEFATITAGRRRSSCRVILHHALLHGIRHYAQLATLVRHHGYKTAPADYLMGKTETVES